MGLSHWPFIPLAFLPGPFSSLNPEHSMAELNCAPPVPSALHMVDAQSVAAACGGGWMDGGKDAGIRFWLQLDH